MTLQFTRLVADENVPREVIDLLRGMGFKEVFWILEKRPGISDPEVWRLAASKNALLLTGDIGYLSQLDQPEVLNGPNVIELYPRLRQECAAGPSAYENAAQLAFPKCPP